MAENKMSGAITKATGAVAKATKPTMQSYLKSMEGEIKKALPSVITPERFTRMTLTALSSNPQLAETTPKSFLAAVMNCAALGLEPNTPMGEAWLIPSRNKNVLETRFEIGYKGLLSLAWRSGEIISITAEEVCENDNFSYSLGLNPTLEHTPAISDRGKPIFYYATFHLKSGGYGFKVMSVEQIREHAKKYSKSANSSYSPWNTDFDSMAKKTVLKKLLRTAPIKAEMARSLAADETIKHSISDDMSLVPDETEFVDVEPVAETLADEAPVEGVVEEVKE